MSNPEKKKSKKKQKRKSNRPAGTPGVGRLISLDGAHGPLLVEESPRLARLYESKDPAWSLWDASNTFHELGMAKARTLTPTPRTLILLYASDLLFRLRWEIEPALKEGRTVVAAPYVETAIAFGVAAGLPKEWMEELFSFAPKPAAGFRLKEKKKIKSKETGTGFVEFCCAALAKNSPGWDTASVRSAMIAYLKELESVHKFGKKLPKALLKA